MKCDSDATSNGEGNDLPVTAFSDYGAEPCADEPEETCEVRGEFSRGVARTARAGLPGREGEANSDGSSDAKADQSASATMVRCYLPLHAPDPALGMARCG